MISLLFVFTQLNGQPVQNFTLPDINNQNISIADHLGKNLIVLDFWASWCAPCMLLLPELEKIEQAYDKVSVISVSIDNPRSVSRAKSLLRSQRYSFLTLFDTNQDVMKQFQVTTVPHTFLLNQAGEVVYEHSGYTRGDEAKLISEIESQLALLRALEDNPDHIIEEKVEEQCE